MYNKGLKSLMKHQAQLGGLLWIGLRPAKRAEVQSVESVQLDPELGLLSDHYAGRSGKRQVTLIQAEHIAAVASYLGLKEVDPALLRRNLVVTGMNLLSLKDQRFGIGEEVILEGTGLCHPCSRMEENLGEGGYNAMRGHGGITARIIRGGAIKLNDTIRLIPQTED